MTNRVTDKGKVENKDHVHCIGHLIGSCEQNKWTKGSSETWDGEYKYRSTVETTIYTRNEISYHCGAHLLESVKNSKQLILSP